jgi:hypothetical protein
MKKTPKVSSDDTNYLSYIVAVFGEICQPISRTAALYYLNAHASFKFKVRVKVTTYQKGIPGSRVTFAEHVIKPGAANKVKIGCPIPFHYTNHVGHSFVYELVSAIKV